jgi:putative CocE/NonD family hydrolase
MLCCLGLLWTPFARAQDKTPAKPAETKSPALPTPLSGFSDSGTFGIYKNEERLAVIDFRWQEDGSYENKAVLSLAGQTVKMALKITPDKDGRWLKIADDGPRGPATVEREGSVAKRTFQGKTTTTNLRPDTTIFDNMSPALLSQAIRQYDKAKGGKQKLPVYLPAGVQLNTTVERKDTVERSIAGRDMKFTRYSYSVAGTDITIWTGDDGKVYVADVPAAHSAYVRDKYELLRQAPETDPLLSQPRYQVKVERDVGVRMRDGIDLKTDIYRPDMSEKLPLILIRTPYQKSMMETQGNFYARRGYAVAVQNCRGRFGSPGVWEPFVHEEKDGHDAVEWLAAQPWCTGKVGMIGGSYVGWVQWWAASQKPPHLVTIIPNVSPPDPYYNLPYEYGVFFMKAAIWWAEILETEATADLSGKTIYKIMERKYDKVLRELPVIDLDRKILGKENPYWRKWIAHPDNDDYWEQANFLDKLKDVNIPAFHQSGWFDGDGIGTKLNYLRMASYGHPNQKLVLGPWGHTDEAQRRYGEHDFGPEAIVNMQRSYLRWFDYWLKGIDNGIVKEPLVSVFVMGANRWLHGPTYPLPGTRFEKWYLAGGGHANTCKGDGKLTREVPAADAPPDRYTYDPANPTPDPEAYEEPEDPADKTKVRSTEEKKKLAEAYHEKTTQERRDILVYSSEPFEKEYTFAGPLSAVLYASSSARDTDWFARLIDVDKSGKFLTLGEGKIRARYRKSTKSPELLAPGQVYEYTLDLWHTGMTIAPGHRLRVEIASASFPSYSRNLNTGGHNETETQYVPAEQTILHDREHPSHMVLPVVELKTEKAASAR